MTVKWQVMNNYFKNIIRILFLPWRYSIELKNNYKGCDNDETLKWLKKTEFEVIQPNKEKLPISVIMPTIKSRNSFNRKFVFPMLVANNPAEIIIVDDEDINVQKKRNKGAALSTQKYLFFCDDDVIIPSNHLKVLYDCLEHNPEFVFAYTDYQAIVMNDNTHPNKTNFYHQAIEFDLEKLKVSNYIDTCSLVRKDFFPGFDHEIERFQDWDLWLTIALKGHKGKYVNNSGIIKYYLDEGITANSYKLEDKKRVVLEKHGIFPKKNI